MNYIVFNTQFNKIFDFWEDRFIDIFILIYLSKSVYLRTSAYVCTCVWETREIVCLCVCAHARVGWRGHTCL